MASFSEQADLVLYDSVLSRYRTRQIGRVKNQHPEAHPASVVSLSGDAGEESPKERRSSFSVAILLSMESAATEAGGAPTASWIVRARSRAVREGVEGRTGRPPSEGGPPTSRHTTGTPADDASATTQPASSWRLGYTNTSASLRMSARTSSRGRCPRNLTRPSSPSRVVRRRTRASSGPDPATRSVQSGSNATARTASAAPFQARIRPAKRTCLVERRPPAGGREADPSSTTLGTTTVLDLHRVG